LIDNDVRAVRVVDLVFFVSAQSCDLGQQTLLTSAKRREIDTGVREGVATPMRSVSRDWSARSSAYIAPRNPEGGRRFFRPSGARPPVQIMGQLIDERRDAFVVDPTCKVLQISPSGYRRYALTVALFTCSYRRGLTPQFDRVWRSNMQVYGAAKVWRQLAREDALVARCTVERLMRRLRLGGVMRGYDNAIAETIDALYNAELIHRRAHWNTEDLWKSLRSNGCLGSTIISCWAHRLYPDRRGWGKLLPAIRQSGPRSGGLT
jgi:hypothetical protein